MNAVGIDVSKGKSMVSAMRPLVEVVANLLQCITPAVNSRNFLFIEPLCFEWTTE